MWVGWECVVDECGWIMSHIWTSHVTHMNESRHTYECVVSHSREGCECVVDKYGWVMSHIWMSHVAHMNESCHTYGWVMSQMWVGYKGVVDKQVAVLNKKKEKRHTKDIISNTKNMYTKNFRKLWCIHLLFTQKNSESYANVCVCLHNVVCMYVCSNFVSAAFQCGWTQKEIYRVQCPKKKKIK